MKTLLSAFFVLLLTVLSGVMDARGFVYAGRAWPGGTLNWAAVGQSLLAFVAGIFVWFIGLAVILVLLKSAGREITWAFQFTNPYFVLAMSAVVLVFALNLFGVFEISLPQWLSRQAVASGSGHGTAGSFFQGVFATILATPCTAPFLGTALGFAFTESATVILLMFVAIATGMSAPYLLLSAEPAWLKFVPKPGPWMVRQSRTVFDPESGGCPPRTSEGGARYWITSSWQFMSRRWPLKK